MKIGIIGVGKIGQAFARQVVKAGYEVIISNSRGPESLLDLVQELGGQVRAGTVAEAAAADVVFLGVLWMQVEAVAASVPSWEGRIVIDPMNPVLPGMKAAELGGKTSSEVVASLVPGAKVVKAFNSLPPELLGADPHEAGGRRVIFYSGNDEGAKQTVADIMDRIGFAGVDLGGLGISHLQQFPGGPLPGLNLVRL